MGFPDIIKLFTREGRKFYFFLAKTTGYWPQNTDLFRTAFIHKSAGKRQEGKDCPYNNERLEYLGDAVIETVVSDILYHKFPDADEGFMSHLRSNMVCRARLNSISFDLGLDKYVVLASRKDMEHSHISGDVLEAFVAAIYLDGGMRRAFKFIESTIANPTRIKEALHESSQTNYKSMLVNLGEQNAVEVIFETRRTDNARRTDEEALNFVCDIRMADTVAGQGFGRSKKQAEQRAAEVVYKSIKSGEIDLQKIKDGSNCKEDSAECAAENEITPETADKRTDPSQHSEVPVAEILDSLANETINFAEKALAWEEDGDKGCTPYLSYFKEYAVTANEDALKEEIGQRGIDDNLQPTWQAGFSTRPLH